MPVLLGNTLVYFTVPFGFGLTAVGGRLLVNIAGARQLAPGGMAALPYSWPGRAALAFVGDGWAAVPVPVRNDTGLLAVTCWPLAARRGDAMTDVATGGLARLPTGPSAIGEGATTGGAVDTSWGRAG